MSVPNFLIIDDHPLFVEALQSALESSFVGSHSAVAHSMAAGSKLLEGQSYNLVLLDLRLPDVSGLEGLLRIKTHFPRIPVVVISAMAGPEVIGRLQSLGVEGFINKGQPKSEIIAGVRDVLAGGVSFPRVRPEGRAVSGSVEEEFIERLKQLTPQQFKVLSKVCEAKLNKQIAFDLGVTETTVKAHITLIFKKLGVHSRTQAVLQMQKLRAELDDRDLSQLASGEG